MCIRDSGPLVQVQRPLGQREDPGAVDALPPDRRGVLGRDVRCVPGPLEEQGGVLVAGVDEHLRQLGEEVELLLPERPRSRAEHPLRGADAEGKLAYGGLAVVEQAVRLPVGAADDFGPAVLQGGPELGDDLRVLCGHALVADTVEVDVARRAGQLREAELVTDRLRQDPVAPQPLHVDPVEVVAERVPRLLAHLFAPAVRPSMILRCPKATRSTMGMIMNAARAAMTPHGRAAALLLTCEPPVEGAGHAAMESPAALATSYAVTTSAPSSMGVDAYSWGGTKALTCCGCPEPKGGCRVSSRLAPGQPPALSARLRSEPPALHLHRVVGRGRRLPWRETRR